MSEPRYWMDETSGVLRPAVEAYLNHETMTVERIAARRAYLRQWIGSPVWDGNPHGGPEDGAWLKEMRARIDLLTTRERQWVKGLIRYERD